MTVSGQRLGLAVILVVTAAGRYAVSANAAPRPDQLPAVPVAVDDRRIDRVAAWLAAVETHVPGSADAAASDVGRWSTDDLQLLTIDLRAMLALTDNLGHSRFYYWPRNSQRQARIAYSNVQLATMRGLACAASGMLDAPPCRAPGVDRPVDVLLQRLSEHVSAARRSGDRNYLACRGALLHTDIATLGLATASQRSRWSASEMFYYTGDGTLTSIGEVPEHWQLARILVSMALTPDVDRPDPFVREWYLATLAWLEGNGLHSVLHVDWARRSFKNDPDVEFIAGCQHETFATRAMQEPLKAAVAPQGYTNPLQSDETELKEAAARFRAALASRPAMPEARLRLGHVLLRLGRHQEALDELQRAVPELTTRERRYYGLLILGAAEEALSHAAASEKAYGEASALFPSAPAPYVALSALAWRQGRVADARDAIRRLFAIDWTSADDDPWWSYQYEPYGDPDERLDALRSRFREAPDR